MKQMQYYEFLKKKRYFFIITIIIVLFAVFIFYNHNLKNDQIKRLQKDNLSSLRSEVDIILKTYGNYSEFILNNVIDKDEVKKYIKKGWKYEDSRYLYRDALYEKLKPIYKEITKNEIRQVHFHFKDGTSFLRMHRPDKYGDNLIDVRKGIKYVIENHVKYMGFEEGRIFNGYRYIYPLFLKEEYIGSVEVSISFEALTELFSNFFYSANTFIIKKEVVKSKVFIEEQSNYGEIAHIDDYLYDKELHFSLDQPNQSLDLDTIEQINKNKAEEINQKVTEGQDFAIYSKIDGNYYAANFISIKGFDNENKGFLISYKKSNTIKYINDNFQEIYIFSLIFLFVTFILFTNSYKKNKSLNQMAIKDQLTDSYNRHKLTELFKREIVRNNRYDTPLTFIILDIDNFKQINDKYGHNMGDQILKDFCRLIEDNIRENDYFGRWGGEEFVIIAPNIRLKEGYELAKKIRKIIEKNVFIEGESITASFGVAEKCKEEGINELIKRADDALYKAKNSGKNRVEKANT